MTAACVLDASAVLSTLVPGQATSAAREFFAHADTDWLAPSLIRLEVRNALARLERRGALAPGAADADLALLESEIDFAEAPDAIALARIVDTSRGLALSVYDATYLELARATKAELVSRDSALLLAAGTSGVMVRDVR